jgi:hypothetical protein
VAVSAQGQGTQTATIGTEHTLLDVAVAGSFVFEVDTNALAAGDSLELRISAIVLTAGTRRVVYKSTFVGVQDADDKIKVSVPMSNELTDAGSLRFTLKQTGGTGRAFPWKVLKL